MPKNNSEPEPERQKSKPKKIPEMPKNNPEPERQKSKPEVHFNENLDKFGDQYCPFCDNEPDMNLKEHGKTCSNYLETVSQNICPFCATQIDECYIEQHREFRSEMGKTEERKFKKNTNKAELTKINWKGRRPIQLAFKLAENVKINEEAKKAENEKNARNSHDSAKLNKPEVEPEKPILTIENLEKFEPPQSTKIQEKKLKKKAKKTLKAQKAVNAEKVAEDEKAKIAEKAKTAAKAKRAEKVNKGQSGQAGQQNELMLNVEHHFMDNGKLVKKVSSSLDQRNTYQPKVGWPLLDCQNLTPSNSPNFYSFFYSF